MIEKNYLWERINHSSNHIKQCDITIDYLLLFGSPRVSSM